MYKGLDFYVRTVFSDLFNFLETKFPGQDHTLKAQVLEYLYPLCSVDCKLGGSVQGNGGVVFPDNIRNTQVLYYDSICSIELDHIQGVYKGFHRFIIYKSVYGYICLFTSFKAVAPYF